MFPAENKLFKKEKQSIGIPSITLRLISDVLNILMLRTSF
jgi:hypothetical protein